LGSFRKKSSGDDAGEMEMTVRGNYASHLLPLRMSPPLLESTN
jgi:hypothetical protein